MKIRALAVAAVLVGCNQQAPSYTASSGSLALSSDDSLLYAVDPDSNSLYVLDAKNEELKAVVAVGAQPEKVVVGHDDTIFVSNRMGRSVSVITRGDWKEARRLDTAVEPSGMAIYGNTLLVVNATTLEDADRGSLMAFDTQSFELKWETQVGNEPRAVAVAGDRAMVSLYKKGDVVTVDLKTHQVMRSKTEVYSQINRAALENETSNNQFGGKPLPPGSGGTGGSTEPAFFFGIAKQQPRGIEALTVSPDGRQVYASTLLSSDTVLPATATDARLGGISGGGGDGYGGGSCGAGSVATPALLTFDGEGNSIATDTNGCEGQRIEGQPAQVLTSGNPTMPIQGPSASVVDPTGAFIFIAGKESNNVAILATNSAAKEDGNGQSNVTLTKDVAVPGGGFGGFFGGGSAHTTVMVGAGPSGIAVSRDGRTAWVLNAFDHSISRLESVDGVVQEVRATRFADETLPQNVVEGRKLFFSAVDSRMSASTTGISCASCHLEGREDSHIWNFTDGPRQTPSLAGRKLSKTAPFHWNGEFEGLAAFMAVTVNHRMGGAGVSKPMEEQLLAFIESQPAPDNPHQRAEFTDAQLRGLELFQQAQCNSCHKGEAFTDNSFKDVGTYVKNGRLNDDVNRFMHGGLNTPSLLGLSRSAPYLHDGSALTLKERLQKDIERKNTLHGELFDLNGNSKFNDGQLNDLVEYLKTL